MCLASGSARRSRASRCSTRRGSGLGGSAPSDADAVACDPRQVRLETVDFGNKPDALAAIAASQHGVVTRAQLLAAGVGPAAVASWVRTGRLHTLHRGVFSLGYISPSPYARMMAAVLACRPG